MKMDMENIHKQRHLEMEDMLQRKQAELTRQSQEITIQKCREMDIRAENYKATLQREAEELIAKERTAITPRRQFPLGQIVKVPGTDGDVKARVDEKLVENGLTAWKLRTEDDHEFALTWSELSVVLPEPDTRSTNVTNVSIALDNDMSIDSPTCEPTRKPTSRPCDRQEN